MSGEQLLDADGYVMLDSDGYELLDDGDDSKSKCCLYLLTPCSSGTTGSGIATLPEGASIGSVVSDGTDCFTIGDKQRCLTVNDGTFTLVSGCDDPACGGTRLNILVPCCDGDRTDLGLRPEDFPAGATIGSVVANPTDGHCYTIGALTAGLTPTTSLWSGGLANCTVTDCPDCCSTCPTGLPSSVLVTFDWKMIEYGAGPVPDCTAAAARSGHVVVMCNAVVTGGGTCSYTADHIVSQTYTDYGWDFLWGSDPSIIGPVDGPCNWNIGFGAPSTPPSVSNSQAASTVRNPVGAAFPDVFANYDSGDFIICVTNIVVS